MHRLLRDFRVIAVVIVGVVIAVIVGFTRCMWVELRALVGRVRIAKAQIAAQENAVVRGLVQRLRRALGLFLGSERNEAIALLVRLAL